MNRYYLYNYNRLFFMDTKSLLAIYFSNDINLKKIAWDVIINDNRLLDNEVKLEILKEIINTIEIEDVWHLASFSKEYNVAKLAFEKLMEVLDEYDAVNRRYLLSLIK